MKPFLSIENLTQRFPDGNQGELTVFENATFGVEKGEFVVILGHSGCGKSTIMNILAGLAEATSGAVIMPPTMGAAMRRMTSAPVPVAHRMGSRAMKVVATGARAIMVMLRRGPTRVKALNRAESPMARPTTPLRPIHI